VKADLSLVGAVQSVADASREVKVGGGNDNAVRFLLDLHDAAQGVLGVLILSSSLQAIFGIQLSSQHHLVSALVQATSPIQPW
jgi:hypothetical protein